MFFLDENAVYKFDVSRLGAAHEWCFREFECAIYQNDDVIVSNTFTTLREMEDYIDLANKFKYDIKIIECLGNYGSVHDVPEATLVKMKARFISNEKLRDHLSILNNNLSNFEFISHV